MALGAGLVGRGVWRVAAGGTVARTMGLGRTMGLFLSPLNTATGLSIGSISLAFAFGHLWWGLTQPFAGMVADRIGTGRVIFAGVLLVALGTFITPFMTTTAGLVLAIGVLSAGGAVMAGAPVLVAAASPLIGPAKAGRATGLALAGGPCGPRPTGAGAGRGLPHTPARQGGTSAEFT